MSSITTFQNGQSDLELAPTDIAILAEPYYGTAPILTLRTPEGLLDEAKLANLISVGNVTKRDGVKLTNNPTINDIKSMGKGSPTRQLASEAVKSITYVPQQLSKLNLAIYWGALDSAFAFDTNGFDLTIPELPANLNYRSVILACDTFNGLDIFFYWLANKTSIGKRTDQSMVDSNIFEYGAEMTFLTDNAVGSPLIFGVCGPGWVALNSADNDDSDLDPVDSITVTPATATITAATGGSHTVQLAVTDSNDVNQTSASAYSTSNSAVATVTDTGLVTGVEAGTATITASYGGQTDSSTITVD